MQKSRGEKSMVYLEEGKAWHNMSAFILLRTMTLYLALELAVFQTLLPRKVSQSLHCND